MNLKAYMDFSFSCQELHHSTVLGSQCFALGSYMLYLYVF